MELFDEFLAGIGNSPQRERTGSILSWVMKTFPELTPKIAWNQPVFTHHGTFIIGFSVSKKHLAIAPENVVIDHFSRSIIQSGYDHTKELIRIGWDKPVDLTLLSNIISYNIADKANCQTFWRK
jgi:uncharacterized protein